MRDNSAMIRRGEVTRRKGALSDQMLLVLDAGQGHALIFGAVAAIMFVTSIFVPQEPLRVVLWTIAGTLAILSFAFAVRRAWTQSAAHACRRLAEAMVERDHVAAFLVDGDGQIRVSNDAARALCPLSGADTLARALGEVLPHAPTTIRRLTEAAHDHGAARETLVVRQGQMAISVQAVDSHAWFWRCERLATDAHAKDVEDTSLPTLMASKNGALLYMNEAARKFLGKRATALKDVFPTSAISGGAICDVQTKYGPTAQLIAEMDAGGGRRMIYLLPPPEVEMTHWPTFHELPVALLKLNADGTLLAHNHAAQNLLGADLEEGRAIATLLEGLGRPLDDWLAEVHAGRAVQQSEFLRIKRADREAFVQVSLSRIEEDGVARVLAVMTDATELKTLEAQFVQSQKMQAIGQLAGGVAHDFNNLLTAISGHCDLLLMRHDPGDGDFADLTQINQNTNRAASLVNQLLAFSRKQTLQPEPLDMRDTISDMTHLLNRLVGEKVSLSLLQEPNLGAIRADKRQFEQVLMNLVVNARDAMPHGGQVRIETEALDLARPLERDSVSVPAGRYVLVRVTDEGVGISKDKKQKIFEPFFTTKRTGEGTGLGLSMVYGIVKQSGGFVFVDSEVGSGTCFSLIFPMTDKPIKPLPAPKPAPTPEDARDPTDAVVLLVEDEAPVRSFARRALQREGYTVLEAGSGEEALKTLEKRGFDVDIFVTDVVMPGQDGPSWVQEALKHRPGVGVVFVSGYAKDKLDRENSEIPNSVFLPKPFSLVELTETVGGQLH